MTVAITWSSRAFPLPPVAVAATGEAVAALAASALTRLGTGAALRAAAGDDWILVLGPGDDLPWCEGATYLGDDDGLLVPTTACCSPPADLVLAVVRARAAPSDLTVALLPGAALLAPGVVRVADGAELARLARSDGPS